MTTTPTPTPEQFIDKELRKTIAKINSIINQCWKSANSHNSNTNQDRQLWISLAKDACTLKADILTNDLFLKRLREAAALTETSDEGEKEE